MNNEEKPEIIKLIEKRLEELRNKLKSLRENEEFYHKDNSNEIGKVEKEQEFVEHLYNVFDALELTRNEPRETYNEVAIDYLKKNLPPKMAKRLSDALSKDEDEEYKRIEEKATEKKNNLINSIVSRNANQKYNRYSNENFDASLFERMKNRQKINKKNKSQEKTNKFHYEKIIDWIENYYVSRYGSVSLVETYYNHANNIIYNPRYINKEVYERFANEISELGTGGSYEDKIEKCKKLLSYTTLNQGLKQKIQKCKDLYRQYVKLFRLRTILRTMTGMNLNYKHAHKEMLLLVSELEQECKKYKMKAELLDNELNLDKIYELREREIEKTKKAKEEEKIRDEKLKKEMSIVHPDSNVIRRNEEWERKYIEDFIEHGFGRKVTENDRNTEKYSKLQSNARISCKSIIDSINSEYRDIIHGRLQKELDDHLVQNYGPDALDHKEEIINYQFMSPEERYLHDMKAAGKIVRGATVEDLTGKDLEKINGKKSKWKQANSIILRLVADIEDNKNKRYTSIYGIEEVQKEIKKIKEEANKKHNYN